MTKAELLAAIAENHEGLTKKEINAVMDELFATMANTIKKEGSFAFPGFGTFRLRKRSARMGRNPQTGETMRIKASKTITFKPAKALKDRL